MMIDPNAPFPIRKEITMMAAILEMKFRPEIAHIPHNMLKKLPGNYNSENYLEKIRELLSELFTIRRSEAFKTNSAVFFNEQMVDKLAQIQGLALVLQSSFWNKQDALTRLTAENHGEQLENGPEIITEEEASQREASRQEAQDSWLGMASSIDSLVSGTGGGVDSSTGTDMPSPSILF